jgi:heme/copper-type cytochrome/quinol oxidase subunit 4
VPALCVMAFSCDRVVFSSCLGVLLIFLLYMVLLSTMLCYYVALNKRKVNGMKTQILLIGLLLASATVSITIMWWVWTGVIYLMEAV